MITAAIFDMDGLLIDSEPLWQRAEKQVFATLGVELSNADCASTMGMRIDEVVEHWSASRPWTGKSNDEVQNEILDELIRLVRVEGVKKVGVDACIRLCQERGYRIGLASSSYQRVIEAVLEALRLAPYFEVVHSAEFEERGKPAPDVYLSAARMLEVQAAQCLVFEDSLSGVRAAKAAGMLCIGVPDQDAPSELIEREADYCLESLLDFDTALLDRIEGKDS